MKFTIYSIFVKFLTLNIVKTWIFADANIYEDLVKIKDLDNRSINLVLQEGVILVCNQYVEKISQ